MEALSLALWPLVGLFVAKSIFGEVGLSGWLVNHKVPTPKSRGEVG